MKYHIFKAVVIGSGTMGAALAAHLANAGVPVTLLDIVPEGAPLGDEAARNKIVNDGWDRCLKAKPANLMSGELKTLVSLGNLEDNFGVIAEADWVIEAIVEDLRIKQDLMARIDSIRKPTGIISTNTSGIPIKDIAQGRSRTFKQHFLGTHFFNPPRYLKLLEIIPITETRPEVVEFMCHFGELHLGKGVVLCKDTPNFIGNRVAFGTGAFSLDYILTHKYSVDEVDAITGPLIGRPKTATFRLIDLVGVDVWEHVGRNLAPAIPHDKLARSYLASSAVNRLIKTLVERKWLGNKTRVGFYKEVRGEDGRKEFYPLDLERVEHIPPSKPRFESVKAARDIESLGERLKLMLDADDRAARLVQALTYQSLQYSSSLLPEIADSPKPLDDAVRWGFQHEAGPFEIWDILGVAETARRMKKAGYPAAKWVLEMLKNGIDTFYQYKHGMKVGVYDVVKQKYSRLKMPLGVIALSPLRGTKKEIARNAGASLYDIGDGVALVEFHTKMNSLDEDIFQMMIDGMDHMDEFDGLVIGSEAENFSAGANLALILMGAKMGRWDTLDQAMQKLQELALRMRYSPKPVVLAPAGLALGGGAELTMHASRVVAASELYIGLVEVGMGLIPAGGGSKEIMRRIINPAMRTDNAEAFPFIQRAFLQIGQARVAGSADEARSMSILGVQDRVVLNRDRLLTEAKREVMHMASGGYRPPAPELIYAPGRDMLGAMKIGAWQLEQGGYITAYDAHIADKLANVLAGGCLSRPQWVDEQYILDLEREAFLSLCGEEKTQDRIWSFLQTGRPLRN